MGKTLKTITLPSGKVLNEVGCGNYTCRYCGAKATQGNYVTGLCLQIRAPHIGLCGAFKNDSDYSGYITECTTCQYYNSEGKCICDKEDPLA